MSQTDPLPVHRIPARQLQQATTDLLIAAGTPETIAQVVSKILVGANLTGHDSHGVLRVPTYLKQIQSGDIQPAAKPEIRRETENTLFIDGQNGFGHFTAHKAMALAIDKAKEGALCNVSFLRTGHIGRLGDYAEQAAHAGCIGLIYYGIGTSGRGGTVPYGGMDGRLSTNPMAAGVPTGDDTPFVLDMATSMVAEGKLQVARSKEQDLPEGYIVNKEGQPTVKTADFYDGGYLLPFGGHKGYGLSLLTCLLGALSGETNGDEGLVRGTYMQVINVEAFTPLADYQRTARTLLDWMKATQPAPTMDEVLVPGDPEQHTRTQRLAEGIDVPLIIYEQLHECAKQLQISIDL
ncbi:MAG: Ldh family oxidoreductase [Chloroflexota bacterium]